MKNVKEQWKRNTLFLPLEEATDLISAVFDVEDVVTHPDMDGIWFSSASDDEWSPSDHEICQKLSEYLDVTVTSFHIDDCDFPGFWIVYKDAEKTHLEVEE